MPLYTDKLNLKLIQPQDYFADESFNSVIQDADDKLVGVAHLSSGAHWEVWQPSVAYNVNDVVRWSTLRGHQYARCREAGTSATVKPTNNVTGSIITDGTAKWEIMSLSDATADSGTILIWLSGYYYNPGDAVYYGKSLYRCKVLHQSTTFQQDIGNWQEIYASIRPWLSSVYYIIGDVVIVDSELYECVIAHMSGSNFDSTEKSSWKLIGSFGLVSNWSVNTKYHVGQVIDYNGVMLVCLTEHTSDTVDFRNDVTRWKLLVASISPWGLSDYYPLGSMVIYDSRIWRCIYAHDRITSVFEDTQNNWIPMGYNLPAYLRAWQPNTYYYMHQTVLVENKYLYKCTISHVSDSTWSSDESNWIRLGGIESVIRDWEPSTRYYPNQVVTYLGTLYRSIALHDSDSTSFENDVSEWRRINANIGFWEFNTFYPQHHLVEYEHMVYRCAQDHTSTAMFDVTKWIPILAFPVIEVWQPNTSYLANQIVRSNDMLLRAIDTHTSDATSIINDMDIPNNNNHWALVYANIAPWQASVVYEIGSQVIYDNNLYRAKDTHTSGATFSISHWDLIGRFDAFLYNWQANKYYYANQVVVVDKELWINDTAHTSASDWTTDKSNWTKISSVTILDDWSDGIEYLVNEIVLKDGILYRCITSHTSTSTFDVSKWEMVYANIVPWRASISYRTGEYVVYNNQLYRCITAHTSASTFEPDGAKWQPVANNIAGIPNWESGVYYYQNQVVRYKNKLWRCLESHSSAIADEQPDIRLVYFYNSGFLGINNFTPLPVSVTLDLGDIYTACDIQTSSGGGYLIVTGTVEGSIDNENFVKICDFTGHEGITTISLDRYMDIRYIRFTITGKSSDTGSFGFSGLKVWGDSNKWEIIADDSIRFTYWQANERYDIDDIVLYDNEFYRCITLHDSSSVFDITKWRKVPDLILPDWQQDTEYKLNQLVWYNNSLWKCKIAHISSIETPNSNEIYSSTNVAYVDDTTTIPYEEIIDLNDVYLIETIDYDVVAIDMTAKYSIETSIDGVTYIPFNKYEILTSARYIKVIANSVTVDIGATSPSIYLDNFIIKAQSDKWQEVSTMSVLTDEEIDSMFI